MAKQDINSLQVLRGIAALVVVFHHAFRAVTVKRPAGFNFPDSYISLSNIVVEIGAVGVDIFFILSGFLMIYISQPYTDGRKSTSEFLISRIIRVWPLYCAVTSILIFSLVKKFLSGITVFDLQPIRLLSLIFLPSFNEQGQLQPILGVGWTLNYEVFFYLIFAISLAFRRTQLLLGVTGFIVASYVLGAMSPAGSVVHSFLFNSVMLEFVLGAGIATAYMSGKLPHVREWIWLVLGLGLLAVFAQFPADSSFRLVTRGLPSALIFIFFLLSDKKISWPRVLLLFGNASYSIYLMHIPVLYFVGHRVMMKMSNLGHPSLAAEAGALTGIVSAISVGIAGHFLLEKPLTRAAKYAYLLARRHSAITVEVAKP